VTDSVNAFVWVFSAERREEVLAIVKLVFFLSV
jgi:hypothetical protein